MEGLGITAAVVTVDAAIDGNGNIDGDGDGDGGGGGDGDGDGDSDSDGAFSNACSTVTNHDGFR